MKLDQRLRLLRGQVAHSVNVPAPSAQPQDGQPDLTERLSRLLPAARRLPQRGGPDEQGLADALEAEPLAPGVLRVERRWPLQRTQGRFPPADCVGALPDLLAAQPGDANRWLFLDTETSGLAGGTGTWAFLTGLVRIDGGDLLLRQYLLTRLDAEPRYLVAVRGELDRAGLLISYNGKSFDIPLLATRLRLAGIDGVPETKPHLDLLHPTRRAFRNVWPDCRLATAERLLLGIDRGNDLPGAEAPAAWLSWLRRGEVASLARVLDHNRQDLLSLPALVPALACSFRRPDITGADPRAVAAYWISRGDESTAASILSSGRPTLDADGLLELARLYRRRGDWDQARGIWQSLAARGIPEAAEALAKHLEHRECDYARALALVDGLPPGRAREHRRHRLEQKLRARGAGLFQTP